MEGRGESAGELEEVDGGGAEVDADDVGGGGEGGGVESEVEGGDRGDEGEAQTGEVVKLYGGNFEGGGQAQQGAFEAGCHFGGFGSGGGVDACLATGFGLDFELLPLGSGLKGVEHIGGDVEGGVWLVEVAEDVVADFGEVGEVGRVNRAYPSPVSECGVADLAKLGGEVDRLADGGIGQGVFANFPYGGGFSRAEAADSLHAGKGVGRYLGEGTGEARGSHFGVGVAEESALADRAGKVARECDDSEFGASEEGPGSYGVDVVKGHGSKAAVGKRFLADNAYGSRNRQGAEGGAAAESRGRNLGEGCGERRGGERRATPEGPCPKAAYGRGEGHRGEAERVGEGGVADGGDSGWNGHGFERGSREGPLPYRGGIGGEREARQFHPEERRGRYGSSRGLSYGVKQRLAVVLVDSGPGEVEGGQRPHLGMDEHKVGGVNRAADFQRGGVGSGADSLGELSGGRVNVKSDSR